MQHSTTQRGVTLYNALRLCVWYLLGLCITCLLLWLQPQFPWLCYSDC